MGTLKVVLGWLAFLTAGVLIGLAFEGTIWALALSVALLIGIPIWAFWSTWTDRTRQ